MLQLFFENLILFFDNLTQKENFNFIKKINGEKIDIFIDVGCHKGETINLSKKFFQINKIYAFEPNPQIFKKIQKSKYDNATFIPKGLWDKNMTLKLNANSFSPSSSFHMQNKNSKYYLFKKKIKRIINLKNDQIYIVNLVTLDSFIEKEKINGIDFLKIDTEGSEFNILKGLRKNLNKIKLILLEHHYDNALKKKYKFSDINNFLKNNGFKKAYKNKMKFRKIFEYVYINSKYKYLKQ